MAARELAVVDLEDFNESINLLVYGDSGMGKTVLGGTAPNALIASSEPGAKAAKRQGSKAKLARLETWEDAEALYANVADGTISGFDWIIIDTLDGLEHKLQRGILDRAHSINPNRDPDLPAIQDHYKRQEALKHWVARMVDLPVNCLFLAHPMRREDEEAEDWCGPALTGKGMQISNFVCGLMDAVGFMKVTQDKVSKRQVRRILWQPIAPYVAKDQFDALGRWTDDATMPDLIEMIEGSGEKAAPEPAPIKKVTPKRRARATA